MNLESIYKQNHAPSFIRALEKAYRAGWLAGRDAVLAYLQNNSVTELFSGEYQAIAALVPDVPPEA
jgi:hypothetical protein